MAPIPSQQIPSTPGVPRPANGSSKPLPGTKYISLRLVLELLAGTLSIFIVGVLAWKLGRFIRSFTRERVLKEGNAPTTRYAKTWYGWIPQKDHERNKNWVRRGLEGVFNWATWSSGSDLRRIWWDPDSDQKEMQPQQQNSRVRQWPLRFHRRRRVVSTASFLDPERTSISPGDGAIRKLQRGQALSRRKRHGLFHTSRGSERAFSETIIRRVSGISRDNLARRSVFSTDDVRLWSWRRRLDSRNDWNDILKGSQRKQSIKVRASVSLPFLPTSETTSESRPQSSDSPFHFLGCSRKYQIWSARMHLKGGMRENDGMMGPPAPPGSPMPELLASFSSHRTSLLDLSNIRRRSSNKHYASFSGVGMLYDDLSQKNRESLKLAKDKVTPAVTGRWNTFPKCRATLLEPDNADPREVQVNHSQPVKDVSSCAIAKPTVRFASSNEQISDKRSSKVVKNLSDIIVPTKILNDWEIRMIDSVIRRLEWNSNQLSPGRRPFHFTLLPNHWLNKGTWIVYDPPSRVSIDAKRRLGDPRFNKPYPKPDRTPKPKYPKTTRKIAHTPRLDSWRKAVNVRRRTLGLQDVVKAIELYDSSADDAPNGNFDPACWILRKPPQGVGLSTKQQNAYYEGGAGWQETLNDWQKVRRGYRIRKAIYEGKVNRTRVKEAMLGITRHVPWTMNTDENSVQDTRVSEF